MRATAVLRPGLRKVYSIDITGVDPKGVGTTQAKRAVQEDRDQMVLTTTTDATLDSFGLVLLADDKRLQERRPRRPGRQPRPGGRPRCGEGPRQAQRRPHHRRPGRHEPAGGQLAPAAGRRRRAYLKDRAC